MMINLIGQSLVDLGLDALFVGLVKIVDLILFWFI